MQPLQQDVVLWRRIVVLAAMELAAMVGLMIVASLHVLPDSLHRGLVFSLIGLLVALTAAHIIVFLLWLTRVSPPLKIDTVIAAAAPPPTAEAPPAEDDETHSTRAMPRSSSRSVLFSSRLWVVRDSFERMNSLESGKHLPALCSFLALFR
ncbi:unnamed protein product [Spirodela intermedia]|uniref:Uncharacterized protein n=1 Tax=Spirodela intermedia TaxID=51605 RepID=A0A7I8J220_SPIIN|nr:unnamed protein product [Spirodela intermedia]CAA6664266.1 unnamed protein product [Spirodela intermedia]